MKVVCLKNLLILVLIAVAQESFAADWSFIGVGRDGIKWFSAESIKLPDGTIRTFVKNESGTVGPIAILIDCKKRRVRDYVAGEFGKEFFKPWEPITPDSVGEVAYKAFCKK